MRDVGFGVADVRRLTSLKQTSDIGERLRGVLLNCDAMDAELNVREQQLAAARAVVARLRAEAEQAIGAVTDRCQ